MSYPSQQEKIDRYCYRYWQRPIDNESPLPCIETQVTLKVRTTLGYKTRGSLGHAIRTMEDCKSKGSF
jgi:hypothetical protein